MFNGVAFIGTGRAAWSLADGFLDVGYDIIYAASKSKESVKEFCAEFLVDIGSTDIRTLIKCGKKSIICVIAVPDSVIKEVAETISNLSLDFKKCLFIHLSGAKGSDELATLQAKGALTGSFHIPQSFTSKEPIIIAGLPVCIEASSEKAERIMKKIARDLELSPIAIKPELKVYYHLAAVFASNFFPAIIEDSIRLFEKAGGNREYYYEIFSPIIETTISNILSEGTQESVSGVLIRKDIETINNHIAALSVDESLVDILTTYRLLTEKTAKLLKLDIKWISKS
jgi:predicted short-subunit dehydrogenase-like oxidoreductase (DUF2520 family)